MKKIKVVQLRDPGELLWYKCEHPYCMYLIATDWHTYDDGISDEQTALFREHARTDHPDWSWSYVLVDETLEPVDP